MHKIAKWIAGIVAATAAPACPAVSQDEVGKFFEGRQLRIIVGFEAGGNSSLYADVLARHMGRYLPGSPTFIVQNMPGAGGLTAANYIAALAPRDGSQISITSRTAAFEPLLGNKLAKFDAQQFNWLGSAFIENSVCVADASTGIKTFADVRQKPLIIGASAGGTIAMVFPKVSNQLLGSKFEIVAGYKTGPDILLAMRRHEVYGMCGIGWSLLKQRFPELVDQRQINVLFQIALARASDLSDVPLVHELASDFQSRQILEFLAAPQNMGRPFFAPPDVPRARVEALRKAFSTTMIDSAFLEDARKTGLDIDLVTGAEVDDILARAYALSPIIVAQAKELLDEK